MQFVNLTPHSINVLKSDGGSVVIPPSGDVARVSTVSRKAGETASGVELFTQEVGETAGLPDSIDGTIYIVSALVRLAHPERCDLASPGELVRNEAGQPVGCRGLVVNR